MRGVATREGAFVAARYCTNCGQELGHEVTFCSNCGRPVQETAVMPTPEADVSVPPLPSRWKVEDAVSPLTEHDGDLGRKEWWQTSTGQVVGAVAGLLVIGAIGAAIFPGAGDFVGVLVIMCALVALAVSFFKAGSVGNGGQQGPGSGEEQQVPTGSYEEPVADGERSHALDEAIGRYLRRGYFVQFRTATTAQLVRRKKFSFLWALFWVLFLGVGIIIYLV